MRAADFAIIAILSSKTAILPQFWTHFLFLFYRSLQDEFGAQHARMLLVWKSQLYMNTNYILLYYNYFTIE